MTEVSLAKHKEAVLKDEIYRNRIQNLRGRKSAVSDSSEIVSDSSESSDVSTSSISSVSFEQSIKDSRSSALDESSPVSVEATIHEEVVATVAPDFSNPLVYSSDDRPLMPSLGDSMCVQSEIQAQSQHKIIVENVIKDIPITDIPVSITRIHSEESPYVSRSLILRRVLSAGASVIALVIIVAGTISVTSDSRVTSDNRANVFSSIGSFISSSIDSVFALFSHEDKVAVGDTFTNPLTGTVPGVEQGIVVIPKQDDGGIDAETIQRIQSSFSDEVDVRPDGSGTAGIITPVFRQAKGADYVYVMVPLNNGRSP